jgi:hypothetical protein
MMTCALSRAIVLVLSESEPTCVTITLSDRPVLLRCAENPWPLLARKISNAPVPAMPDTMT